MPETLRREEPDDPRPQDLEPNGYLLLQCKDTGDSIELRIDMLPRVRHWQWERPRGWVRAISRVGEETDFWWPSIRRISVLTHEGRARSIAIDEALDREAESRHKGWE